MGSVHYFSPEQARGEGANATSDIYSTGVVLYEMLTGKVPYDGDNPVAVAMQHLHATPVPIQNLAPDVPPALIRVCMKAMEKNPAMRYQTARDMAADIRDALENRQDHPVYPEKELEVQQPKPQFKEENKTNSDTGRNQVTGPQRERVIRILMTIILGIALVTGLFFGVRAIFHQVTTTATVPAVLEMNVKDAEELLTREGLKYEEMFFNNENVKVNTVFVQKPEADTVVRKGDTVLLSVSSGPAQLTMPELMGMNMDEATTLVRNMGLIPTFERVISDSSQDTVVSQNPAAQTKVDKDTLVTITISGGKTTVPVLKNMTLAEAEDALRQNGLKMGTSLNYVDTRNAKEHGKVSGQSPAEDMDVMLDTEVSLSIFRYPTDMAQENITIRLPESSENVNLRITLQAEESEIELEAFQHDFTPELEREQPVAINLPDDRQYTCRVYVNGEMRDSFGLGQ